MSRIGLDNDFGAIAMADQGRRGNRGGNRPGPGGRGMRPGHRPPPRGGGPSAASATRKRGGLGLRHLGGDAFELVHPACVEEMRPDYEEGLEIWKAGEPEEARDALRFALQGCGDNLWVHVALGRIALESSRDPSLARGHFGYAYELATKALPPDFAGKLPRDRRANQPFFDALDGLIACCNQLGLSEDVARLRMIGRSLTGS